ncbi:hypothetical protein EDEG_02755 [Edhazardia aedis USNM 41457]|uniref:GATA-type domain-containing protein n=1 Tax=Edhazardia aedis (strain USNM 41457) TaxID=1003232 RepID=J9DJS6_EDHAE|nr:hypothetical protein EDEG_02755 [Edhazardia aedis USNM 41457]|eukprot:EJW02875.1 hypothetical protein EDEG_02755 [Edhazardia aedis USNM 41457]
MLDKHIRCKNCNTNATPLWRRYNRDYLCNACGLYMRIHQKHRPVELASGNIKQRVRNRKSSQIDGLKSAKSCSSEENFPNNVNYRSGSYEDFERCFPVILSKKFEESEKDIKKRQYEIEKSFQNLQYKKDNIMMQEKLRQIKEKNFFKRTSGSFAGVISNKKFVDPFDFLTKHKVEMGNNLNAINNLVKKIEENNGFEEPKKLWIGDLSFIQVNTRHILV